MQKQSAFKGALYGVWRVTLLALASLALLVGRGVAKKDLAPGDLVWPKLGHVQLYVGGGRVIEAPRTGLNVRNAPLGAVWKARRVV